MSGKRSGLRVTWICQSIRVFSTGLCRGTESRVFYTYLPSQGWWWVNLKKKPYLLIPPIPPPTVCCTLHIRCTLTFTQKRRPFPNLGSLQFMFMWPDVSNCSNHNSKKIAQKISILDLFKTCYSRTFVLRPLTDNIWPHRAKSLADFCFVDKTIPIWVSDSLRLLE